MAEFAGLYRAFGIDFQSALALPELRDGPGGTADPVVIALGSAPRPMQAIAIEPGVAAGPRDFWMEVPEVARLLVSNGSRITVDMAKRARESDVRAFLLGSALGALLHQRGLLPIHASAVLMGGQVVAFAGTSEAGKSTLALHLARRGHPFLCDDICAIDTSGLAPVMWPGLCNAKLWRETLTAAGQSPEGLEQVLPSLDKYRLPMANAAAYRHYAIGSIFCLDSDATPTPPKVERLSGADAAGMLIANTFRGQLIHPMGRDHAHFTACVSLARLTTISSLSRPWAIDDIEARCAAVERAVRG